MRDIEDALKILEQNISAIRSVEEWAKNLGYARSSKFSWEFRKQFGERPQKVLIDVRVEKIIEYMLEYPEEKNYCVALEFGFANDKRLSKFIKSHTGLSPTELKKGERKRRTKKANEKGERKRRTKKANEKGERKRRTKVLV